MIPSKGFSYPNHRGRVFYHPEGVKAFSKALKEEIGRNIPVRTLPFHINDEGFAEEVVADFKKMVIKHRSPITDPRGSLPDPSQGSQF